MFVKAVALLGRVLALRFLKLLSLTGVQRLFFYSHGGFFYSGPCLPFKCFHSRFIAYFIRSVDKVCFGLLFFLQHELLSLLKQPQNVVLHVIPENVQCVIFQLW